MKFKLLFILFSFLLSFGFVIAQLGGVEDQIKDTSENLENNITAIKEFTEKDNWNFIGSQWKEFLLKNKSVVLVDSFFTKINPLFLFLFARDWSLSLGMLFVFLLWLFTLLSAYSYASAYDLKKWQCWLASIAGVMFFAHIRLFNVMSAVFEKILLYRAGFWWSFFSWTLVVILIYSYLFINKFFSKRIKLAREKDKQERLENEVDKGKVFRENLQRASNEI
ncbi:MAG: hypothetical protein ACP5NS_03880 [Candidatus Pacearchaeota archaeon]